MPQILYSHIQFHQQKEVTIYPMFGEQAMSVLPVVALSAVSTTTLTNKSIGDLAYICKAVPSSNRSIRCRNFDFIQ